MIFMESTPHCAGVTLYGDYYDLKDLYETVFKLSESKKCTPALSDYILGLCYDIRHAYEGRREKIPPRDDAKTTYFGVKILYPVLIFQYRTMREVAGFRTTSNKDQSNLYRLQYSLEEAIQQAGFHCAQDCITELDIPLDIPSDYLFEHLALLNMQFMKMNKTERKKSLYPQILGMSYFSQEYRVFSEYVKGEAKKQNVSPQAIRLVDVDIKWKW